MSAYQTDLAQGKDTQQDIAHVADAAVSDQAFEIGLPQGDRRAVDDADYGQDDKKRGIGFGHLREDADADADHAVAAHLQQGPGQDHADAGRSIGMGIRQPGMQREDRQLDGKADNQQEEDAGQRDEGSDRTEADFAAIASISRLPVVKYRLRIPASMKALPKRV